MTRTALALAVLLSAVPLASARTSPGSRPSARPGSELLMREAVAAARQAPAKVEYVLTEKTEVRLNDRPCRYEDVPANATITVLEVAPDRRTLVRIHFRTEK